MFDPFAGMKPRVRLVAWRRSRCWKCDTSMSRVTRQSWFCRRCIHLVTYGQQIEPPDPSFT